MLEFIAAVVGVVRQLEVHRGRRGLAVDLDLQGVQGGLVGLAGQAQGQAGVDRSEAGSVGRDEALRCGEVRGQSVGGEVRSCGQGGQLALQRSDGGGVGADVRGVLRGGFQRRVLGEDEAELRSCPAEMPWSSMTGGAVTPSSSTRPVSVDGKRLMFKFYES